MTSFQITNLLLTIYYLFCVLFIISDSSRNIQDISIKTFENEFIIEDKAILDMPQTSSFPSLEALVSHYKITNLQTAVKRQVPAFQLVSEEMVLTSML